MKGLTICQPFAWAIVFSTKRIENRKWSTSYRGPLVIHAGKSRQWLGNSAPEGIVWPAKSELDFGVLLGVANLIDCVELSANQRVQSDHWAEGPFCWVLECPKRIKKVQYSGGLGLLTIPDELVVLE